MELNTFLETNFRILSFKDVSQENNFSSYENFKKFIDDHYNLDHIENNNYIKYVKVKRQIIRLNEEKKYSDYISNINLSINKLSTLHIFPKVNIKNYMFRINTFFKLIDTRERFLYNHIINIRELFMIKNDYNFYIKIMNYINSLLQKYKIYKKEIRTLNNNINKLLEFEFSYGIDHKLIEINNMERSLLGKKSEYNVNKVVSLFINNCKKKYFYINNIDLLKLFGVHSSNCNKIKGELDGVLLYYDGNDYIIEKIIEVKSSIKSTYEDISKFLFLQKFIIDLNDDFNIIYDKYIFNKKSFINIVNYDLTYWLIYICINNIRKETIEKSYFYFSNVLKIVDDDFIKSFYIDKDDISIKNKYKIVCKKRNIIDKLYNTWADNVKLGTKDCNIYILK